MYVISISYKRTPLKVRGQFAFTKEEQRAFLQECRESSDMAQSILLSTCNRLELYTFFTEEETASENGGDEAAMERRFVQMEKVLSRAKQLPLELCRKYESRYAGQRALRHLHRVASGVDSMVMGEDEILGQVKDAYYLAQQEGCTGFASNTVFKSAITCAKKIKTDTSLSKTAVSVATLAAAQIVHFIKENALEQATVMIIGITGATGGTVMKNLRGQKGISILGTSRQHGADGRVISIEGVTMTAYEERYRTMGGCDVIVSATGSPHYTVTKEEWQAAYRKWEKSCFGDGSADNVKAGHRKTLFLDLSVPADIDSGLFDTENVCLYQMDYFRQLAEHNNEKKQQARKSAEHMIEEQLDTLQKELFFHRKLPDIPGLVAAARELRFEQILYRVRDGAAYEELQGFFAALEKGLSEE